MDRYLLEIGVEEFPSKYIKSTQDQIRAEIEKFLNESKYSYKELRINSTPRRFAIRIDGIEASSQGHVEKIKGPSKKIALKDGQATKALEGFLRSKKLTMDDIVFEEVNGEDYVFATIRNKIKDLSELLAESIPAMIKGISNPKAMRWGGKNLRFLRPIRWIVSLLNDKILEFDLEGIRVSNISKGHRTLGSSEILINSIDEYEEKLKENYVIVSEEERRKIIIRGLNRLSKEKGGNFIADEELLTELININEYPTPFVGSFDNSYLKLPKEVIITPMKDHQRYFPIENDNGNLLPYFIAVRNGDKKGIENVIKGNEKVLVARLEDAKFFYEQDIEKKLEDYVPELKNLGYYDGLGNMLEKSNRLVKFVPIVAKALEISGETVDIAQRAAYLSKADLVTKIVIEFTELQGVMGKIYAKNSGENRLVSLAIEEQYMPRYSGASLPITTGGIILSLAEKIDNICGLYSIGVEVTGSQDPYGQRRSVLGVLNILIDSRMNLDLIPVIKESLYLFVEGFGQTFDYDKVVEKIGSFIRSRFKNKMIDEGFRYDIVESVLNQDYLDIYEMYEKIKAVSEFLSMEDSELKYQTFLRVKNISENAKSLSVNKNILTSEDMEIYKLNDRLESIDKLINIGSFKSAIDELTTLTGVVDNYLDNTIINVNDLEIKNNRLALIKNISKRIEEIFDVREIVRS